MTTSYLSLAEFRVRSSLPPADVDQLEALAYGPITNTPASGTVSGASNASPIVIQTTLAHGVVTGDSPTIAGVLGNGKANGQYVATFVDSTHFSLGGTSGAAPYTGGGTWQSLGTATIAPSPAAPSGVFAIAGKIITSGTVGVAGIQYQYSTDGGVTFSSTQSLGTANAIVVPGTGASFLLGAGSLESGQSFACTVQPPFIEQALQDWTSYIESRLRKRYVVPFLEPVPFTIKKWLCDLASKTCWSKRGFNPSNKSDEDAIDGPYQLALAEIKEAADAKEGLFDLPARDDLPQATGVTFGRPKSYSEASPYTAGIQQRTDAVDEDQAGVGTTR